jgi:hypothetical protein
VVEVASDGSAILLHCAAFHTASQQFRIDG